MGRARLLDTFQGYFWSLINAGEGYGGRDDPPGRALGLQETVGDRPGLLLPCLTYLLHSQR